MAGHQLGDTQLRQERAIAFGITLDVLLVVPYSATAIATGSLAILAELLRGVLLLITEAISLYTLRRINRGHTGGFDYGLDKAERAISGLVGMLLISAAGFIVYRIATKHTGAEPPTALGVLAMAAVLANLFSNVAPLIALLRSAKGQITVTVLTQIQARIAKTIGSLAVVVSVAIDMFSGNRTVALVADLVGGTIGAASMLLIGAGLIREALPDLLDRAPGEAVQMAVNQVLARFFDAYDGLDGVRTRRAGRVNHVEITVRFSPDKTMGEVDAVMARMTEALREALPESDVVVVARASHTHSADGDHGQPSPA